MLVALLLTVFQILQRGLDRLASLGLLLKPVARHFQRGAVAFVARILRTPDLDLLLGRDARLQEGIGETAGRDHRQKNEEQTRRRRQHHCSLTGSAALLASSAAARRCSSL